jgi:hypothetical protein
MGIYLVRLVKNAHSSIPVSGSDLRSQEHQHAARQEVCILVTGLEEWKAPEEGCKAAKVSILNSYTASMVAA